MYSIVLLLVLLRQVLFRMGRFALDSQLSPILKVRALSKEQKEREREREKKKTNKHKLMLIKSGRGAEIKKSGRGCAAGRRLPRNEHKV